MTTSFGLYGVEHGVICYHCGSIAREVCRRTRLCERCYGQNSSRHAPTEKTPTPVELATAPLQKS